MPHAVRIDTVGPTSSGTASLWRVTCKTTGISITVTSQYAYGAWVQARPLVGSQSFDDCEFLELGPDVDAARVDATMGARA